MKRETGGFYYQPVSEEARQGSGYAFRGPTQPSMSSGFLIDQAINQINENENRRNILANSTPYTGPEWDRFFRERRMRVADIERRPRPPRDSDGPFTFADLRGGYDAYPPARVRAPLQRHVRFGSPAQPPNGLIDETRADLAQYMLQNPVTEEDFLK